MNNRSGWCSFWQNYRAPLLCAAVLFVQSSIPDWDPPVRLTRWDDKWAHVLLYLPLGFLLLGALARARAGRSRATLLLLTFILGTLYGISDEMHQHFVPGRHMDWRDAVADSLGVMAGGWLHLKLSSGLISGGAGHSGKPWQRVLRKLIFPEPLLSGEESRPVK
ncbi:MAG: VanZ family protein [candidate division KSB1 bacterium]|nr:VanZ family protein [candidate division KSB1 bacterium]